MALPAVVEDRGAQLNFEALLKRLEFLEANGKWVAGDIKGTAKATVDAGWLLCDGAPVSRTAFAALFAAVGTAYGAGDGSTTFNLPNLLGRVPMGAGAGTGLTARTRGQTPGAETVTADLAAHTHTGTTNGADRSLNHQHTVRMQFDAGVIANNLDFQTGATRTLGFSSGAPFGGQSGDGSTGGGGVDHLHTFTTASAGAGGGHANVQPSAVVNFIIRAV